MFADVILPLNLPRTLIYGVPVEMQDILMPGMRVEVGLGKNKFYSGIVERLHHERPDAYQVKPIKNIIDDHAVVNQIQLDFWRWVGNYYMASPGEVMQAALPAHLKLMAETRLQWIADEGVVFNWSEDAIPVVDAFILRQEMTFSELKSILSTRKFTAVLNELLENEALSINDSLQEAYKPKKEKILYFTPQFIANEPALIALFKELERAPRQLDMVMAYTEISHKQGYVRQIDLLERTKGTATQIQSLIDKNVFIREEKIVDRIKIEKIQKIKEIEFTDAQFMAMQNLNKGLASKNVALLHGVTGSGKTLLYIQKIRECIVCGKQAIMLVPEIALTTQLVGRLHAYFGDQLGVYHSHFSNNERVEIWEKVRKGIHKVVVGPRSILWLPYQNLGVIIVDEEHDVSYKQRDPAPRFHARDAAIYLASLFSTSSGTPTKIILGSATPSIESVYNVKQGKYAYISLKERFQGVNMPLIEIVNAKSLEPLRHQGVKMITPELQLEITEALKQHKQVILFQNRRGYAPFQICVSCGWVPHCTGCSVSLTYHKITDKMHCHYCGTRYPLINTCPVCGGNKLVSKSFGTERIEEEVQLLFPRAKISRMDVDSMRGKHSMKELLDKLEKGKIDILVGTQMVVKGLDFASVSLVGILSADGLLSFPDFRVNERAFQMMEQVSGRAGRVDGKGKVIIQAYDVQNPVLQWVKHHDSHSFYQNEMFYREKFAYPPFTRFIRINLKHVDENKVANAAQVLAEAVRVFQDVTVQGPGPAMIARVQNQYIYEIWIKCPKDVKMIDTLKVLLKNEKKKIQEQKGFNNVIIVFDVDPY